MANNVNSNTTRLRIWHTTTLESAAQVHQQPQPQQQQTYQTTVVAGRKRTVNESLFSAASDQQDEANKKRPTHSRQGQELPRFTASIIAQADDTRQSHGLSEYSQRRAFPSTPTSTVDPLLSLSHHRYDLPRLLVANFAALGIKTIYPWQKKCLLGPGLLEGEKNLVYSAPTGGGKSLVADVLMLKRVLDDRDAKAILVLPYVALVQEKVRWLRNVVAGISREDLGQRQHPEEQKLWARRADKDTIRVVGFFGGSKIKATWADFDIAVCTIEKANSLVNAAIDDCSVSKLKAVVLDECHMIDDGYRGYLLELVATKLLCLDQQVQIVAMSATLTNINLLRDWLRGHSYETHYRPVPIEEHLVYDGKIYPSGTTASLLKTLTQLDSRTQPAAHRASVPVLQHLRSISPSEHKEFKDPVLNAVVSLANETARAGYGVLVFSSSRAGCESDAVLISRVLPSFHEADPIVQEKRLDLLGDLRSLSTGIDPKLEQTVPVGVAFHHAGLTTEERDLVANAYDAGVLKVIVATCSLAAGINLPARRVILHNARMGRDLVGPSMLRQMRGRAGRKGKDEVGETYLCCRQNDLEAVVDLMHADLPQISSCLISDKRRIRRALFEVVAIRLANSRESLDDYVSKTMLSLSAEPTSVQQNVEESLIELRDMGFITIDQFSNFEATQLGKAIVASSLDPEDGIFIHNELKSALKAFVLDGEMHVLYTFTPVHDLGGVAISWRIFWNEMEQLDESGLRVMTFLGLKPVIVNKMLHGGTLRETTPEEKETSRRYHRFYLALQLRDLCNEVPVHRVALKYGTPRGTVQTLAQTCQGFAAGMIKFCESMGWGAMAAALDHFSDRLKAGARSDLLALAKITFVKSRTARIFWDNGFKTVAAVANADPKELLPVLMQAQPNKVRLEARDEQKYTDKLLAKAKVIADSANRIWRMCFAPLLSCCFWRLVLLSLTLWQRSRCDRIWKRSDS
ncbi:P-loop containing nucleoside triphosphate hydrolase protein [Apodospora peruviana]|uniref:P-loop containing nucleoside triphosphate hydrolase protein n=1 Tax=Apodospora peruviana TaxID=516989 RepID=A0AAE0MEM6_9PEZI|nr:P-loop containing nucleoside triphosphate hydrolase protein [Apodospora peruviana]